LHARRGSSQSPKRRVRRSGTKADRTEYLCGVPDSVRLASRFGSIVLIAIALLSIALSGAAFAGAVSARVAIAAAAILAVMIGIGVIAPGSGIFARPVLSVRTARRELALTFDDGPDPRWTPPLLDLLEAHGQRGTFFVIGARAEQHTALLADMTRRGHEIANHTWAHALYTACIPPRRLAQELERTNVLIERATGVRPAWFRPPVGLLSPRIAPAVRLAGLRLVTWTASARDGVRFTTVPAAFARLKPSIVPGAVLVLHDAARDGDREPIARELLRVVLDRMESEGLRSVTLSELCASSPLRPVGPNA
jgi:peptidoglycan/xylan/chitin deacetylase (PgdA/CDA1 family)